MKNSFGRIVLAASLGCLSAGAGLHAVAAEVTLKSLSAAPRHLVFMKPMDEFERLVNERGKGVVKIAYLGGPEAIPTPEQFRAISTGLVDVHVGPNQWFQGQLAYSQVFNPGNKSVAELREGGGFAAIQAVYRKHANLELLNYLGEPVRFYLYLRKPPKRTADGGIDLSGLTIRGTGTEKTFLHKLGAVHRNIQVPEMYTALQRGAIDGVTYVNIAVTQLGLHKFLKYRVRPTFAQGDLATNVNLDRWKSLSREARAILNQAARDTEIWTNAFWEKIASEELAKLRKEGMEDIVLSGKAAKTYVAHYTNSRWEEIAKRIGPDESKRFHALFTK